jgi:hypothetical protein
LVALLSVGPGSDLLAQAMASPPDSIEALRAEARRDGTRFTSNRTTLAFELSRSLVAGERLALLVETADVSSTLPLVGASR